MKVQINNCIDGCLKHLYHSERKDTTAFFGIDECIDRLYLSDDRQFAVIKKHNALYIAVKVMSLDDSQLLAEYVDYCFFYIDEPVLYKVSCDWSNMCYGFCKLRLWAPENCFKLDGYDTHTIHRFYFDRNLYELKKKERHGDY